MCDCIGTCGCSSVSIPQGIQGSPGTNGTSVTVAQTSTGVTITDGAGNIVLLTNGTNGTNGSPGTSTAKYAVTITVPSATSTTNPYIYTISNAAITSCNALLSTCASSPQNFDFNYTLWFQSSSNAWVDIKSNTAFAAAVQAITYNTSANQMTIQFVVPGTYRIVIHG